MNTLSLHDALPICKNVSVSCAYTQGKREQFSGFNRTLDAINNVFRKFSAFHDETGRLNVDGMNIISNDGSNKLNRSRKARVSYKVQRTINASLNAAKKFKIAEGQWYRYAPSYVSPAYHLLEGFPFIQEPPSGDLQERVLIRHHDYDQCFQSVQLLQWNSQVKFNVTVYR